MTSDSLTTNSPDTPDGRPVIEIFEADPNVLIYTSQTAEEGNLDVDTSTGELVLKLEDLKILLLNIENKVKIQQEILLKKNNNNR